MAVTRTVTNLRSHDIVVDLRIIRTLVEPDIEMIKANAALKDGSVLHISEATGEDWRDYSYHWEKESNLIRRWDNAPHYKDLPNFPYHVHEGDTVLPGNDISLTDVLAYIETEIKKQK